LFHGLNKIHNIDVSCIRYFDPSIQYFKHGHGVVEVKQNLNIEQYASDVGPSDYVTWKPIICPHLHDEGFILCLHFISLGEITSILFQMT
jgi:hypothetical protein